jgi:hypothetical protein
MYECMYVCENDSRQDIALWSWLWLVCCLRWGVVGGWVGWVMVVVVGSGGGWWWWWWVVGGGCS